MDHAPTWLRRNLRTSASLWSAWLTASVAIAAPPIPFDGYTVNSGNVTPTAASCPDPDGPGGISVVCSAPGDDSYIVSDGMLQREVVISGAGAVDGTYIQFVLTDPGVTGNPTADPFSNGRGNLYFTNEDFVKMNNRTSGISSKQVIIESASPLSPTLEDRFFNETNYQFGWANSGGNSPWVRILQEISQVDYSQDPLNPTKTIDMKADITSNGNNFSDNMKVALSQEIDLEDPLSTVSGGGSQGFNLVRANGQYQYSSNPTDPMLPGGTNGGSVTWSPNDEVKALWIGQLLDKGSISGGPSKFGLTQYTGTDTSGFFPITRSSTLISFSDTTAVNWDLLNLSIFGPAPVLPAPPMIVSPTYLLAADPLYPTIPVGSAPIGATTPVSLPIAYYDWTVNNGVFTVGSCPPGVTCGKPIVNENGIFQREITLGGITYIHTIITDSNASGNPNASAFDIAGLAFKSENFVRTNSSVGNQGIASILDIEEQDLDYLTLTPGSLPSTGGQFAYNTEIKTGWANGGPLDPSLSLSMRLLIPDYNFAHTSSLDYKYDMKVGETEADKIINMSSVVGTVTGGNGFSNPIMFSTSIVMGAFQNTSRTLTDPALLPSTGKTIAWNPYEAIQATWIGGEYVTPDPGGPSHVNTLSYTNLSKTAAPGDPNRVSSTSVTPFASASPETWVNPFSQPPPSYSTSYIPDPF